MDGQAHPPITRFLTVKRVTIRKETEDKEAPKAYLDADLLVRDLGAQGTYLKRKEKPTGQVASIMHMMPEMAVQDLVD